MMAATQTFLRTMCTSIDSSSQEPPTGVWQSKLLKHIAASKQCCEMDKACTQPFTHHGNPGDFMLLAAGHWYCSIAHQPAHKDALVAGITLAPCWNQSWISPISPLMLVTAD